MGTRRGNGYCGKRRPNGAGSLKMENGIWRALFSIYDESLGRSRRVQKSTGTSDYNEANNILNSMQREYELKGAIVSSRRAAKSPEARASRDAFLRRIEEKRDSIELERVKEMERRRLDEIQKLKDDERRAEEEKERNSIGVSDAFVYYKASKRRPDSGPRTMAGYEGQYEIFAAWMKKNHPSVDKIHNITPDMADEFLDHLEKTRSKNTRNKYLTLLRTIWRTLRWEPNALLAIDPWDGIRKLKTMSDTVHHKDLTIEQIARAIAVMRSKDLDKTLSFEMRPSGDEDFDSHVVDLRPEMIRLFYVMTYLGCRVGDGCCSMEWENIDLENGIILYTPMKTFRNYGWKITVPIHDDLKEQLLLVPESERYGTLCPLLSKIYLEHEESCIVNRIQEVFRKAGFQTVVDPPKGSGGSRKRVQIGSHSFRHFVSATLQNQNLNQELVNYICCHSQSSVAATYFHQHEEALRDAIALLPHMPKSEI